MIASHAVEGMKDRAAVLRFDHDLSFREIGERLGVSKSTVGEWLKGHGEAVYKRTCPLCNEDFRTTLRRKQFCTKLHAAKHFRVFGPLVAG